MHWHSQTPIVVEHILLRGTCALVLPYQRSKEMKVIAKQILKEVQNSYVNYIKNLMSNL
jgi:hypothetical protein